MTKTCILKTLTHYIYFKSINALITFNLPSFAKSNTLNSNLICKLAVPDLDHRKAISGYPQILKFKIWIWKFSSNNVPVVSILKPH